MPNIELALLQILSVLLKQQRALQIMVSHAQEPEFDSMEKVKEAIEILGESQDKINALYKNLIPEDQK